MHFDPHTIQLIIRRIEQQMRCPQCGKKIPVEFGSVRLAGDDFMLLQLRCDTCDAYIVLHASLQGGGTLGIRTNTDGMVNASSSLSLKDEEVASLRAALQECGGSFEQLFRAYGPGSDPPVDAIGDTRLA